MKKITSLLVALLISGYGLLLGCAFHFPAPSKTVSVQSIKIIPKRLKTQIETKYKQDVVLEAFEKATHHYDRSGHLVKVLRFETTNNDGVPATHQYGQTIFFYDAEGNLLKKIDYNEVFGQEVKRIFRYDALGNKVEEIVYDKPDNLAFKVLSEYDQANRLVKEISRVPNGETKVLALNRYNEKGYLVERIDVHSRSVYEYDEQGNKVKGFVYNPDDDSLRHTAVYQYNRTKTGSRIDESVYEPDETLSAQWLYEYDKRGYKIKQGTKDFRLSEPVARGDEAKENPEGGVYWTFWTYKYDRRGKLIEQMKYAEAPYYELHYKGVYTYNRHGNLVDHTRYSTEEANEDSIIERTTYQYEFYSKDDKKKSN